MAILGAVLVAVAGGGAAAVWLTRDRNATHESAPPAPTVPGARLHTRFPEPTRKRHAHTRAARHVQVHNGGITAIDTTPDGKLALTASRDQTVKLWSTADWTLRLTLPAAGVRVLGAAFVGGGKYVAANSGRFVRLFDAASGALVESVDLGGVVIRLAARSDGERVVAATSRGQAMVLSIPSLETVTTLTHAAGEPIHAVAYSPDGKAIATGGSDGHVRVWGADDGAPRGDHADHAAPVDHVDYSPDGSLLAAASDDGYISIRSATSSDPMLVRASETEVWTAAFSPDGGTIVAGDKDGNVIAHTLPAGYMRWRLGGKIQVEAIAFSRDGRSVFVGDGAGYLSEFVLQDRSDEPLPVPDKPLPAAPDPATLSPIARARLLLDTSRGDGSLLDEAETIARALLKANPNDVEALAVLGRAAVLGAMQNATSFDAEALREGLAWYDKAIALQPGFERAHRGKAFALLAQAWGVEGEARAAKIEDAKKEAALVADPFESNHLASKIAQRGGDLAAAREHAVRAVRAAPDAHALGTGYVQLIEVDVELGRLGEASAVYRRSIELEPDDAWAKGNYAQFLMRIGDVDQAITVAEAALGMMDYPHARRTLAIAWMERGIRALWDSGKIDVARSAFQRALAGWPDLPVARYGLIACDALEAETRGSACSSCEADLRSLAAATPSLVEAKRALERLYP